MNFSDYLYKTLPSSSDGYIIGFGLYPIGDGPLVRFNNGDGIMASAEISNQFLSLWSGNFNIFLAGSARKMVENTWHYIEVKYKPTLPTSNAGDFELKLDGVVIISVGSGVVINPTGNAVVTGLSIGHNNYFDDLYIVSATGNAIDSGDPGVYLGDVRVVVKNPNGNGIVSDMTNQNNNSTNNYESVNATFPPGDTTYVQGQDTTGSGMPDFYTFSATDAGVTVIYGLQMDALSRLLSDNGDVDDVAIYSGIYDPVGMTYYGFAPTGTETHPISDSFVYTYPQFCMSEFNPITSAQWLVADVDSVQYGIRAES
jgi:hypothetical protein